MARKMSNICELTAPDMLILAVRLIQPSIVFVVICGDSSHICLDPPAVVTSASALFAGIPDRIQPPVFDSSAANKQRPRLLRLNDV